MKISNSFYEMYLDKYGKLIHTISRKVSGDFVTCEHEDNFQDLCISGIYSVISWQKKFPLLTEEEIMQDPNFDKYTKTCLWNSKNKKGKTITKKINLYKNKLSLDVS